MFLVTQFIGLYVVNSYSTSINPVTGEEIRNDLPFNLDPPEEEPGKNFVSLIIAFMFAFFLIFFLMKYKLKFIILSWFFIGLAPVFLSSEGLPHALRAILTAPVVFLFAGEGAWWFFSWLKNWYSARDKHPHEAVLVSSLVMIIFLGSLGLLFLRFVR